MSRASLLKLAIAVAIPLPAFVIRLSGIEFPPHSSLLVYGAAIVGAAVLLAWAAETAQLDISGSLAIALLALIAVLPEYAVDLVFAYTAGHDPSYAQYAAANMTGSNRLLLGFGWPLVALVAALGLRKMRKRRATRQAAQVPPTPLGDGTGAGAAPRHALQLLGKRRIELMFLGIACLYSFVIPAFRSINLWDGVVLLCIYGVYLWRVAKEERQEPELIGVCAYLGCLPKTNRRAIVIGMFVAAAAFILASAEPFAHSLVLTGKGLGIDEFLLVQWLAPLVSESPELIVACLLAYRLRVDDAIGTLLSSKVNQWTLLVGAIPFAYLLGGGEHGSLPLDGRQTQEFILTGAQTVLGFAILLDLRFSWKEAVTLAALFFLQFPFPQTSVRLGFSAAYILLGLAIIVRNRKDLSPMVRHVFGARGVGEQTKTVTSEGASSGGA
ncbi:MAG: sodium:proton exchanger [Thermoleophilia bacterium]|nr:sodium:proton exchanger [Thermoleophilia bacterium]